MIVVAGHIEVRPEDRPAFLAGSAEAVLSARATVGCLDFAVSPDPVEPGRVNVYERWTDHASLRTFREDGPGDDLNALIVRAEVSEFETAEPDRSVAAGSSPTAVDEVWLRRAIDLSAEARRAGDQPFGSLLVDAGGTVLLEARNTVVTDNDLSAHPELKIAVWAAGNLDPQTARSTTMYTSCENCAMCSTAMVRAGIGTLVFALSGASLIDLQGATDRTVALSSREVFGRATLPVEVRGPALEEEARAVHSGYWSDTVNI